MPRRSQAAINHERQRVLELLRAYPDGLSARRLLEHYSRDQYGEITLPVLRKRLDELVKKGLIAASRRYNPVFRPVTIQQGDRTKNSGLDRSSPKETEAAERVRQNLQAETQALEIELSRESEAILSRIRLPRSKKTLVTYRAELLDAYEPGKTWYLPQALRDGLRALGTTAYAGQPAGTYARDIIGRLIIDLSWGSSRLEGNKYSRIDTEELFKRGEEAQGASDVDRQMILNHKEAIEFLVENAEQIDFNRYTILGLHALLAENLVGEQEAEGRLRTKGVVIGDSAYTPTTIPQVIEERFDTILEKARAIPDPLEQSFFMMVHIPYLQPFDDVNKRTSRLAANIPLIKANLCPLSFVDVPERQYTDSILAVYELNEIAPLREIFSWAYRRSCSQFMVLREVMGAPDPIRLNYRQQLRDVVTDVVTSKTWPTDDDLQDKAKAIKVPDSDRAGFVAAARRELLALRPEIASRYRVRYSDIAAWLAVISDARKRGSADDRESETTQEEERHGSGQT